MKQLLLRITLEGDPKLREMLLEEITVRAFREEDDTDTDYHLTDSFIEVEQMEPGNGRWAYHFKEVTYPGYSRDVWLPISVYHITKIEIAYE